MSANRLFLLLTALVFALFGLWGLFDPDAMVSGFGIELTSGEGRTLIRASYGGFLIGAAAIFGLCAGSVSTVRIGNLAVIALTAPIFLTRAFGVMIDGGAVNQHLLYLAIEAVGIALAGYFWLRGK